MKNYSIKHEIGIKTSAAKMYQALTDTKLLSKWWTKTQGNGSKVGADLDFWFGDFCQKFEVKKLQKNKSVVWKVTDRENSMNEWFGTSVTFRILPDKGQCYLRFSHDGWKKNQEMYAHCLTKWAVFMLSLKDLLEKGKGKPVPYDIQVNHN